jgi:hypothetical protein
VPSSVYKACTCISTPISRLHVALAWHKSQFAASQLHKLYRTVRQEDNYGLADLYVDLCPCIAWSRCRKPLNIPSQASTCRPNTEAWTLRIRIRNGYQHKKKKKFSEAVWYATEFEAASPRNEVKPSNLETTATNAQGWNLGEDRFTVMREQHE